MKKRLPTSVYDPHPQKKRCANCLGEILETKVPIELDEQTPVGHLNMLNCVPCHLVSTYGNSHPTVLACVGGIDRVDLFIDLKNTNKEVCLDIKAKLINICDAVGLALWFPRQIGVIDDIHE